MARFTQTVELLSNASADSSAKTIDIGGRYLMLGSATWASGSVKLQILGPDGSTYLDVPSASLSANGSATVYLPDNATIKAVKTGSPTAMYLTLRRCPEC